MSDLGPEKIEIDGSARVEPGAVKNAITVSGGLGEDLTFSNDNKEGAEVSDGTSVIDILGSLSQDETTIDLDQNPADSIETDSFNFDATNLAGVLSVLANQSIPAQNPNPVNDSNYDQQRGSRSRDD